jgi:pimeloyl-ACP methyl ester carboxylesterase
MERGYVTTRWGQVHLRRAGDAGPAVVLLHESPLSSAVYQEALPYLGADVRAIAFDTPGYGMSDGPEGIMEIPDYAATLLEAVDALGVDRFAVAGVHTGASLAVQLAVQAPERVTHAILSGVPVWTEEERERYRLNMVPVENQLAAGQPSVQEQQRRIEPATNRRFEPEEDYDYVEVEQRREREPLRQRRYLDEEPLDEQPRRRRYVRDEGPVDVEPLDPRDTGRW